MGCSLAALASPAAGRGRRQVLDKVVPAQQLNPLPAVRGSELMASRTKGEEEQGGEVVKASVIQGTKTRSRSSHRSSKKKRVVCQEG